MKIVEVVENQSGSAPLMNWPRGLDRKTSISSGILLLAASITFSISETLPWSEATLRSGRTINVRPAEMVGSTGATRVFGLLILLCFAFGLNRLGVLRLWRWLQFSALWPILAIYFLIDVVANEAMVNFHVMALSESISQGVGPSVCAMGIGLAIFGIIIEAQGRRSSVESGLRLRDN